MASNVQNFPQNFCNFWIYSTTLLATWKLIGPAVFGTSETIEDHPLAMTDENMNWTSSLTDMVTCKLLLVLSTHLNPDIMKIYVF